MNIWLWVILMFGLLISIVGSVFIVMYVLRKHRERDAELGIGTPKLNTSRSAASQGKRWNRLIGIYLLSCLIFIIIILYQSVQGTTDRQAFDCAAVPVGALFFIIQAFSARNTAIRRELATAYIAAAFLMLEVGTTSNSGQRSYHSVFEFSVEGKTYRVRYAGKCPKEKGAQVELYYAPEDPHVVYIPEMENRKDKLSPMILFAFGILFPIIGVFAPLFR